MTSFFDDLANSEQKLLEQLSSSPLVEIIGLVNIKGVGASRRGKEKLWTMTFKFDVWRIGNGKMEKDLFVRRQVTDRELKKFQRKIKAESIIKIRGRVLSENTLDSAHALFEKYIKSNIHDSEIENHLTEIRKPVVYQDDLLGTFNYNRRMGWFENVILWGNEKINLRLDIEKMGDLDAAIEVIHILYKDQAIWNKKIVDYAVSELLPLKNESWIVEDEEEITQEQFKKQIELLSITVHQDGSYEFWYDDGDLFLGHALVVSGNITDGPDDVDLVG